MIDECDIRGKRKGKQYHCWSNASKPPFYLGCMFICKECLPIQQKIGKVKENFEDDLPL